MMNATVSKEPGLINDNGTWREFIPKNIKTNRDAYGASLAIMLKHMADFHYTILEVLSEKYKINIDDMVSVLNTHPKYQDVVSQPIVSSLGYFETEDLEKVKRMREASLKERDEKDTSEYESVISELDSLTLKKKRKRVKKVSTTA
jgi:hypothetical protein